MRELSASLTAFVPLIHAVLGLPPSLARHGVYEAFLDVGQLKHEASSLDDVNRGGASGCRFSIEKYPHFVETDSTPPNGIVSFSSVMSRWRLLGTDRIQILANGISGKAHVTPLRQQRFSSLSATTSIAGSQPSKPTPAHEFWLSAERRTHLEAHF
jgi:hypothetical protein